MVSGQGLGSTLCCLGSCLVSADEHSVRGRDVQGHDAVTGCAHGHHVRELCTERERQQPRKIKWNKWNILSVHGCPDWGQNSPPQVTALGWLSCALAPLPNENGQSAHVAPPRRPGLGTEAQGAWD